MFDSGANYHDSDDGTNASGKLPKEPLREGDWKPRSYIETARPHRCTLIARAVHIQTVAENLERKEHGEQLTCPFSYDIGV